MGFRVPYLAAWRHPLRVPYSEWSQLRADEGGGVARRETQRNGFALKRTRTALNRTIARGIMMRAVKRWCGRKQRSAMHISSGVPVIAAAR